MNLFADIRALVIENLVALAGDGVLPEGLDLGAVAVEPPRDASHGDMATNAAMALAKPAKMNPRALAEALAPRLAQDARVEAAEIAGPGFINLRLAPEVWRGAVATALESGPDYGRARAGAGRRVNIEFVSANPTGPMHVGHARGAVFGDALAGLMAFAGWDVTREYYINDAGAQVDVLARSAHLRYREALGEAVEIPAGLYPGDYLRPVGEKLAELHGRELLDQPEETWLPVVRTFAIDAMLTMIRADLKALGVEMDHFQSEAQLAREGRVETALETLEKADLIYVGTLEPPKGKTPEDWEPRPQTLFRSTAFGDDMDRPLKKSDGAWTYFAPDIAYHFDKVSRGYDLLIDVLGADHAGYVKRLKAVVSAVSGGRVPLEVKLCQLVKLFRAGEPVKMSKRSGTFVTLREVVEEVGPDVARFTMLTRRNDAALDFDFAKAVEQSKDNPVFYVQYAHARVASMRKLAAAQGVDLEALARADLSPLVHPAQIGLARKLAEWPRQVEQAAEAAEPHRVAFYLYDLASTFHSLYNLGRDEPALRVVQDGDAPGNAARIALASAVSVVISAGLGMLGVTPLDEM
ncbi:arginine--tRNA ligase [Rubrimonas cliftonensis]|uniref:Arginine--tRNA ligase n=1 Tax=Rubrimonas cliftonensis TaxID=89524 RepID=A0A1H3VU74_9RHOB|nr:arginine--tRNA ligase [Rubrimonas cliftonensis]SDZ77648.1 arginyl-tRNA synthetase [Rubrimonas cliftonensis]